jgi:hypothetical protein
MNGKDGSMELRHTTSFERLHVADNGDKRTQKSTKEQKTIMTSTKRIRVRR